MCIRDRGYGEQVAEEQILQLSGVALLLRHEHDSKAEKAGKPDRDRRISARPTAPVEQGEDDGCGERRDHCTGQQPRAAAERLSLIHI